MSGLKVLVITQKIDENDDILGFFYTWMDKLAQKVNELHIITLGKREAVAWKNIYLYSIDGKESLSRLRSFFRLNKIAIKILFKKRIDIVFIHMCPEYAISVAPYVKLIGIPIIMWRTHGSVNLKLRIAHFLSDRIVTSSKEGFRLKSNKLVITGHGIDVEKFRVQSSKFKVDKTKKIILSVGRIAPIKDYETLIKSADILVNQKQIKDLEFHIAGGTTLNSQKKYADILRNMIGEYKLENYVHFIGPIPYSEIHKYYQRCSLFISTSLTGSLDKAPLEAMACEKVILTCNESFENVLGSYAKELMFEKKNAAGLAGKIAWFFCMYEQEKKILAEGLRGIVLTQHRLDRLTDNFIDIFKNVLV